MGGKSGDSAGGKAQDSNSATGGTPESPLGSGGNGGESPLGSGGEGGEPPLVLPGGEGGAGGEGGEAGAGGAGPACTADLATDPENCGVCGHSCLGGQCKSARCTPVELAKDQLQLQGLVGDGSYVYWVTSSQNQTGKVLKVPFAGGQVTTLATNQPNPGGLVLDQGNLFWSNVYCCSSTIMKVSASGNGSATPIASGQAGPQGLTLYDGAVYWPNHVVGGTLMMAATSGGNATPIVSNLDRPAGVAVDSTHVYWIEDVAGIIRKAPRAGGASTLVASGQTAPNLLLASGKDLYWRSGTTMVRLALNASTPEPYQPAELDITSMTLDGQNIYWAAKEGIKMAPLKGGSATTLVTAKETGGSAAALWVDSTSVYWLDYKAGRVVRMAR